MTPEIEPELRRELGTLALTIYGVGVIVGAGVFVLVGEVAAGAGAGAWLAFLGAALAALPTGLAYAELASRYPESAGEAVFAGRAFGRDEVSFLVGFVVVASGATSVAAVAHGFAGYLGALVGESWPRIAIVLAFLSVLSVFNARGIRESTWLNVVCTIASVLGLSVLVIGGIARVGGAVPEVVAASGHVGPSALLGTIALAFYAFIGFEDLCNVAEETRTPSRSIPRAILFSLAIATLLYVSVAITAVAVVPAAELAADPAPLALVAGRLFPGLWTGWLSIVALLAVTNTALFNLVMTSRVLYGMARQGMLPRVLGRVDPRRKTPQLAVALAFLITVALAATGALSMLARATNVLILSAFAMVNLSLIVVRARKIPPSVPVADVFRVPIVAPVIGLLVTLLLLTQLPVGAFARAGIVVAIGVVLHLLARAGRARDADDGDAG